LSVTVLIADGDFQRGKRLAAACEQLGLGANVATHGAAALEIALLNPPSVLIAQFGLPLIDGAQLGEILQANPRTRAIGVIYLADDAIEAERRSVGGEIVGPPIDSEAVARRAQALVEERIQGETGSGSQSDDVGGVEGQLSQLPLADLLQLFHVSQKNGSVDVRRGGEAGSAESGRILLRAGEIVHAEIGSLAAEKALFRLLAWDRGEFKFTSGAITEESTLDKPTRALLQEGLRQNQELALRANSLPPLDSSVHLKVRRSSLPVVIHPLTQEVLLVLEAYSRVGDVVDHCSFPDYQVLRTLHTLVERGMVELRDASYEAEQPVVAKRLFSHAPGARLREWMGVDTLDADGIRDARLLVVAADPAGSREFSRLIGNLPGAAIRDSSESDSLDRLGVLGRLAVDDEVGIEFAEVPADPRFSALWPLVGHGAVGILMVLTGPVAAALEAVRPAFETLRALPRARIFHLLLLEKDAAVEADALRENLSVFDDSSLFLIPIGKGGTAEVLLREMLIRILP
jgi:CheY-like chemotaxis protein